jgi:hypothetical protein
VRADPDDPTRAPRRRRRAARPGTAWARARHGWPSRFPLVQLPNAPLIVALVAWLVAALTAGSVHDDARAAFYVALAAWAWLELADGVNWARRVLGAGVLVFLVVEIGAAITG